MCIGGALDYGVFRASFFAEATEDKPGSGFRYAASVAVVRWERDCVVL